MGSRKAHDQSGRSPCGRAHGDHSNAAAPRGIEQQLAGGRAHPPAPRAGRGPPTGDRWLGGSTTCIPVDGYHHPLGPQDTVRRSSSHQDAVDAVQRHRPSRPAVWPQRCVENTGPYDVTQVDFRTRCGSTLAQICICVPPPDSHHWATAAVPEVGCAVMQEFILLVTDNLVPEREEARPQPRPRPRSPRPRLGRCAPATGSAPVLHPLGRTDDGGLCSCRRRVRFLGPPHGAAPARRGCSCRPVVN